MRLAFGVVTAYRPDILIIDEALSVGDSYFKHKSFAKIREFKEQGTSMLIVSHDRGAIQVLCEKAVLLDKGKVVKFGESDTVMDYYHALIADKERNLISQVSTEDGRVKTTSGTGEVATQEVGLINGEGFQPSWFEVNEDVVFRIAVKANSDVDNLVVGFLIKDNLGQPVFGTNTQYTDDEVKDIVAGESVEIEFKFQLSLGPGNYSVSTALSKSDSHLVRNYEWVDLACVFSVRNESYDKFSGVAALFPIVTKKRFESL
jgi:lipopolysaccharide transport system ATP-binding protein